MDLSERSPASYARHPWETARLEAIAQLLEKLALERPRVLDVGCGDAYLITELAKRSSFAEAVAQDPALQPEIQAELDTGTVRLIRELEELGSWQADLVLLLDVLEHIQRPAEFVRREILPRLAPGARLLVTVPAFQTLFTSHDTALRHFRRYRRSSVAELAQASHLSVLESGYLFSSLLLPRALETLRERVFPRRVREFEGVGKWSAGASATRWIHRVLCADNRLCLAAHGRGLTLPGLSVWMTCAPR